MKSLKIDGAMVLGMIGVMFLLISLVLNSNSIYKDYKPKKLPLKITYVVIKKQPKFYNQTPSEGLKQALEYYGVKHSDIVYAQAILETGYFKSNLCVNNNNLFGLYDSKNKQFYKFNHWSESVKAYKDWVQYKYSSGDYYSFLKSINYAEDKNYINKLKTIINKNKL